MSATLLNASLRWLEGGEPSSPLLTQQWDSLVAATLATCCVPTCRRRRSGVGGRHRGRGTGNRDTATCGGPPGHAPLPEFLDSGRIARFTNVKLYSLA